MQIIMRSDISGARNGVPWPPVGGVIDVSDDEARQLIAGGMAEAAPVAAPVEVAVQPPAPEVAAVESPVEAAVEPPVENR